MGTLSYVAAHKEVVFNVLDLISFSLFTPEVLRLVEIPFQIFWTVLILFGFIFGVSALLAILAYSLFYQIDPILGVVAIMPVLIFWKLSYLRYMLTDLYEHSQIIHRGLLVVGLVTFALTRLLAITLALREAG